MSSPTQNKQPKSVVYTPKAYKIIQKMHTPFATNEKSYKVINLDLNNTNTSLTSNKYSRKQSPTASTREIK